MRELKSINDPQGVLKVSTREEYRAAVDRLNDPDDEVWAVSVPTDER